MKQKLKKLSIATLIAAAVVNAQSSTTVTPSETINNTELNCLATAIYHESKSEPKLGKFAVAFVVNERKESGKFPNSFCKVTKQVKPNCQFTFACKRLPVTNREQFEEAKEVAYAFAVMGKHNNILPEGTMYFHSKQARGFKRKKVAVIGNHVFYR
jgi:spore germination cell wall hydrolase CwlJ-like protein